MEIKPFPDENKFPRAPDGKTEWPWTVPSKREYGGHRKIECSRITVVTPSFNQGQFLEETIRSVLQALPHVSLIQSVIWSEEIELGYAVRFFEAIGQLDPWPKRSVQWDSFRFWETLSAGAIAFHVDLKACGVDLPVMPENWRHYIGIDFSDADSTATRLEQSLPSLGEIAAEGRVWALRYYSPKAMPERFLNWVGDFSGCGNCGK